MVLVPPVHLLLVDLATWLVLFNNSPGRHYSFSSSISVYPIRTGVCEDNRVSLEPVCENDPWTNRRQSQELFIFHIRRCCRSDGYRCCSSEIARGTGKRAEECGRAMNGCSSAASVAHSCAACSAILLYLLHRHWSYSLQSTYSWSITSQCRGLARKHVKC